MKIILSGGGTLGPVVPLLAIKAMYLKHDSSAEFVWVGTASGPERAVVEQAGVPFKTIMSGKFRRYWALENIVDIAKIKIGFFQSLALLHREKPDLIISAGGFVSVPLHWAAAVLRIPAWVHQQDIRIGLANKLMFPFAKKITTALKKTAEELHKKNAEWIGNPVRDLHGANPGESRKRFNIPANAHVVFVLGGGTGSESINHHIVEVLPMLPHNCHVIHLAGRGKQNEFTQRAVKDFSNYHSFQFFGEADMKEAYALADVVVARAGFSTLTELASLGKAAIIIPMPETHQEDNAKALAAIGAVTLFNEGQSSEKLAEYITALLNDKDVQRKQATELKIALPTAQQEVIITTVDSFKR